MATYESVVGAILDAFLSDFNTAHPGVPVEHDNGESVDTSSVDSWARIVIREADTTQKTIGAVGSRNWQTNAVVIVQLFSRTGQGAGFVRAMASTVRDIFRGKTIGSATFRGVRTSYQNPGDIWFQQNLVADFYSRDVK